MSGNSTWGRFTNPETREGTVPQYRLWVRGHHSTKINLTSIQHLTRISCGRGDRHQVHGLASEWQHNGLLKGRRSKATT